MTLIPDDRLYVFVCTENQKFKDYHPKQPCRCVDWPESRQYARLVGSSHVTITLNGEPFELEQPLSVTELLEKLEIDPRRVAVEHNLTIIKRNTYISVVIGEGDTLEIVNAVGGG